MRVFVVAVILVLVGQFGCSENQPARVDRVGAQAGAERPVVAEVALVSIPLDSALPTWVVVVEPFVMGASGVVSGTNNPIGPTGGMSVINPGEQIGPGVAAQLVTSLQRVGNIVVIDYDTYRRDPEKITNGLKSGEEGPFVIQGTVTEFNETADVSGQGQSPGPNIPSLFIPYVGGLVSHGIGTKTSTETKRTGMVGLDIRVVNPTTGRLVTSFTSEGSFTSVGSTSSRTTWGNTKTNTEYAASAIGQAQRIALNQTITQIHDLIRRQPSLAQGH